MTEQVDLFTAARARAEAGIQRAADATERREPGWTEMAAEALRQFAREQDKPFTIELARAAFEKSLPPPNDKRSFGAATRFATSRGFIERVPGMFFAAASSNNSPKPVYVRGPNA